MRTIHLITSGRTVGAILATALVLGACSSSAATQAPAASTANSAAPSSAAPASAPASVAASGSTVMAATAGGASVLVAGSNGMTVYTFTKDTMNGTTSACTGGCATTWPPLTVKAGTTPSLGAGATGKLGTITRDDGSLQVTYNGLPIYFFSKDTKPGDTNGHYTNWNLVTP